MAKEKEEKKDKEKENNFKFGKELKKNTFPQNGAEKYHLIYTQNRSKDLHVGREILKFEPYGHNPYFPEEYKNGVPKEIIKHKDFQGQAKYFTIKEAK